MLGWMRGNRPLCLGPTLISVCLERRALTGPTKYALGKQSWSREGSVQAENFAKLEAKFRPVSRSHNCQIS